MQPEFGFATTTGLLSWAADYFGDREAVVDGGTRLTFEGLRDRARVAARALVSSGVEPGDRVAVWAPNVWEWVVALFGVHGAGAVLVPVNTRFKGEEAGYLLEKSGAKALLTVSGFLGTDYVGLLGQAGVKAPKTTVVLRGEVPDGCVAWDEFLASGDGDGTGPWPVTARADDLSDILFTSGTTGRPKGAMCTHGQSVRAFADWSEIVGLREGDRYLVVNPFFHAFGYKAGILASVMRGATLYPHAVFDPGAVLDRIVADRITMLPGPPALYQSLLADPRLPEVDVSSLRLAVTGAASIPVDLVHRMRDTLGFDTVVTGYGLTEANGIATMCRHDDDPETIATTSGRAIPDVEVEVAPDGEVLVRGYNVMRGYFDDPPATAETIDAEGWLHTGDIGEMDERGYLRITDRKKDVFIVGGFNAYPAEIENVLLGHSAVAQAAVVGLPDERLGEVGAAFVVLRPGAEATQEELLDWVRPRLANFKVPRRVEFVDALPLNASGKVLKYQLRAQAAGAAR